MVRSSLSSVLAALTLLAGAGAGPVFGQQAGGDSKAAEAFTAEEISAVREKMAELERRANAWALFAFFDKAQGALREREILFETLNGRTMADEPRGPTTSYVNQTARDSTVMRLRARAYAETVARFRLPERTLSNVRVHVRAHPYLLYVLYTVPPPDLKEEQIAAQWSELYNMSHIPRSRSYVRVLTKSSDAATAASTGYQQVGQLDIPEGYTPFHVNPPKSTGPTVLLTHGTPGQDSPLPGVMTLGRDRPLEFEGGPCAGPVVFLPGKSPHLDSLAIVPDNSRYYGLKRTENGVVLAVYWNDLICREQILFEGKQIATYTTFFNQMPQVEFDAGEMQAIDEETAVMLAGWYGLRHDVERYPGLLVNFFTGPKASFGRTRRFPDRETWTLTYGNPDVHVIAGRTATICLDDRGRLLTLHDRVTPR